MTPQYNLVNIVLLEAQFIRQAIIDVKDQSKVKHDTIVNVSYSDLELENFAVHLEVSLDITYEGVKLMEAKVVQSGMFVKVGEIDKDNLTNFVNINAPAIIFPFVRETIASLSAKALLGPILIQPVNFIKLFKDRTQSGH